MTVATAFSHRYFEEGHTDYFFSVYIGPTGQVGLEKVSISTALEFKYRNLYISREIARLIIIKDFCIKHKLPVVRNLIQAMEIIFNSTNRNAVNYINDILGFLIELKMPVKYIVCLEREMNKIAKEMWDILPQ